MSTGSLASFGLTWAHREPVCRLYNELTFIEYNIKQGVGEFEYKIVFLDTFYEYANSNNPLRMSEYLLMVKYQY